MFGLFRSKRDSLDVRIADVKDRAQELRRRGEEIASYAPVGQRFAELQQQRQEIEHWIATHPVDGADGWDGLAADDLKAAHGSIATELGAISPELEEAWPQLDDWEQKMRELERDLDALADDKPDMRRLNKFARIFVWVTVGLVTVGVVVPIFVHTSAPSHIRQGFYAGAIALAPVLFVAGIVEGVAADLQFPLPHLLSFAIPLIGSGVAALDALANGGGTQTSAALTESGLALGTIYLIGFALLHAIARRDGE